MKIEADTRVAFPRDLCFQTYRDRIVELVPHLPNVTSIEVKERDNAPDGNAHQTRLLNEWRAVSEIPAVARSVIKPEMLAWHDHALWDGEAYTCHWRVETHFFKERIRCEGDNFFVDEGDSCLFQIRGELDIDLAGIPGVPKMVANKVGSSIEKFVVKLLTPNLTSVSQGLEAFLQEEQKKKAPVDA